MLSNIYDYPYLKDSISTIKETSYDKTNNIYMSNSERKAINFDQATNLYCQDKHVALLKSNDALLPVNNYNKIVFIEFKNGKITRNVKSQLKQKNKDSIKVICDVTKTPQQDLKEITEYILVYNLDKNSTDIEKEEEKENKRLQQSASFNIFAQLVGDLAHTEHIAFGLSYLKNEYFKDVHTFDSNRFNKFLEAN